MISAIAYGMYLLGMLYIIVFTVSIISTELLKSTNRIFKLCRIGENDKHCIVEFAVYILICTPTFLLHSPAVIPGIFIGIAGWITLVLMKLKGK